MRRSSIVMLCLLSGTLFAGCSGGNREADRTPELPPTPIPTLDLSGTVTGAIARGVTVTLSGAASATALTDETGTYRFTGLPDGTYTITPAREGYTFFPASASLSAARSDAVAPVFKARVTPGWIEQDDLPPELTTPASGAITTIPVIILKYLPTSDGEMLDVNRVTDYWALGETSLSDLKRNLDTYNIRGKFMLEEGSRFRGYANPGARPFLGYRVVASWTIHDQVPKSERFQSGSIGGSRVPYPDFLKIASDFDFERYVNHLGVKEIWIWMGQSALPGWPSYDPSRHRPEHFVDVIESNMASPTTGDISNSHRTPDDLPVFENSYVVYSYNIRRTQAEMVHNHGHQLEAMFAHIAEVQDGNSDFFWRKFVGRGEGGTPPLGRAGDTHHPPNTTLDYDYENATLVESDIEDWGPDGSGTRKMVNSSTWGAIRYGWPGALTVPQLTESQWYIYWMQNMPGLRNGIPHGVDREMSNWWIFVADWDAAIRAGRGLHQPKGSSGVPVELPFDFAAEASPGAVSAIVAAASGLDSVPAISGTLVVASGIGPTVAFATNASGDAVFTSAALPPQPIRFGPRDTAIALVYFTMPRDVQSAVGVDGVGEALDRDPEFVKLMDDISVLSANGESYVHAEAVWSAVARLAVRLVDGATVSQTASMGQDITSATLTMQKTEATLTRKTAANLPMTIELARPGAPADIPYVLSPGTIDVKMTNGTYLWWDLEVTDISNGRALAAGIVGPTSLDYLPPKPGSSVLTVVPGAIQVRIHQGDRARRERGFRAVRDVVLVATQALGLDGYTEIIAANVIDEVTLTAIDAATHGDPQQFISQVYDAAVKSIVEVSTYEALGFASEIALRNALMFVKAVKLANFVVARLPMYADWARYGALDEYELFCSDTAGNEWECRDWSPDDVRVVLADYTCATWTAPDGNVFGEFVTPVYVDMAKGNTVTITNAYLYSSYGYTTWLADPQWYWSIYGSRYHYPAWSVAARFHLGSGPMFWVSLTYRESAGGTVHQAESLPVYCP